MTTITTKFMAGMAMGALLVPGLALAHEGKASVSAKVQGNVGTTIGVKIDKAFDRIEHKGERDANKVERQMKRATTTAQSIIKKATRIQATVDAMAAFNTRIATLIASSSVDTKTALEAKFAEYKADATRAKAKASLAIAGAAGVNANNSTTTNASLLTQAKIDLRAASTFLHDATQALFSVLRSLWK